MTDLDYSNIRKTCEICDQVFSVERHEETDPMEGFYCHKCKRWVCADCTCFVETDAYSSVCKECCACVCGEDSNNPSKSYLKAEDFFCYNDDGLMSRAHGWLKYAWISVVLGAIALSATIYFIFK